MITKKMRYLRTRIRMQLITVLREIDKHEAETKEQKEIAIEVFGDKSMNVVNGMFHFYQ